MGRKRTGSIRRRGNRWLASVPRLDDHTKRVESSFRTEAEAETWIARSLQRLERGLDPVKPTGRTSTGAAREGCGLGSVDAVDTGAPGGDHDYRTYALAWHHEYYDVLHKAGPERADDALGKIERFLLPTFDGPIETDVVRGRKQLTGLVRTLAGYGPEPGDPPPPIEETTVYATRTVSGVLWLHSKILSHARTLGAPVEMVPTTDGDMPALTAGISAMKPRGRTKRKAQLVSIDLTARIAAHMTPIHQMVLWTMRIAGLRISEAYGLLVANFMEHDGRGYLLVEAQGGRAFKVRDDNEQVVTTHRLENGKTDAAYRLIALADSLSAVFRAVIAAFHTDPATGEVGLGARLVPPVRSAKGGQAGFRSALAVAAEAESGASDDPDAYVVPIPHDARKAYATDLAWTPEIDRLVKRRAMGHRAGSDVFDLVYTLDDRLMEHMRPAADAMEAEITRHVTTLLVPTAHRPHYGKNIDADRLGHADAVLRELGWQIDLTDGYLGTSQAADMLGMSETATRRLFGTMIPATKGPKGWRVQTDNVLAYRERLAGHHLLTELAAEVGVSYHAAYNTLRSLDIAPETDDYSRQLLLTDDQAQTFVDAIGRLDALRERSMTHAEAAAELRIGPRTVERWIGDGRLEADPERDNTGRRYVTRQSVAAEAANRSPRRRTTVSIADLKRIAQIDDRAVKALIDVGHLTRARPGTLTLDSVRTWATGYRPDLLAAAEISSS